MLMATVISVTPFKVKFDGEDTTSSRVYKRLNSYTPIIGDRVIFMYENSLYVCLGKVV